MTQPRRNIMLGTAGHVDHGKTALVKLLTGCNTDSLAEEQRRGLTIDLGFAPCQLADQRVVGIVDVPGHVDFIRNMVAGAHGIDVVILVVAADDGIMPQTHEHLHILTLMGVRHGLVALTKVDRVDDARRLEIVGELQGMLRDTFLRDAPICPVCNLTGEGFDGFFDALNAVVQACADRPRHGSFGVWVEDAFAVRGSGTVVTGIPTRGVVRPTDPVHLLPLGRTGHVRRLQVYGEEAQEGGAGECVALNIPELELADVQRGAFLSAVPLTPVTMAEAELRLLPHLKRPVPDYTETILHIGTATRTVRLALLEERTLLPGKHQIVQLRWNRPLCLTPGERFVLRANLPTAGQTGLTTIGGGVLLETSGTRLRRQRPWTLERLRARRDALGNPADWAEVILRESASPVSLGELAARCLWDPETARQTAETLVGAGRVCRIPGSDLVHESVLTTLSDQLLQRVDQYHQSHPDRAGIQPEELVGPAKEGDEVTAVVLHRLLAAGSLQRRGAILALKGFHPRVTDRSEVLRNKVEDAFRRGRWTPPTPSTLQEETGATTTEIRQALRALVDEGLLAQVSPDLLMHRDSVEAAQSIVLQLLARKASFTTMEFRDALGVSRKFAVPLLDYLDSLRWTTRSGNLRMAGHEARRNAG